MVPVFLKYASASTHWIKLLLQSEFGHEAGEQCSQILFQNDCQGFGAFQKESLVPESPYRADYSSPRLYLPKKPIQSNHE